MLRPRVTPALPLRPTAEHPQPPRCPAPPQRTQPPPPLSLPATALQAKSFAATLRKWLAVNPQGEVRHLELAKMRVTAGLGVQLRDLR